MIQVFLRGATICIEAFFKDWEGQPVSPSEGAKVTITDPEETVKVNAQAMTPEATGQFAYYYTPPEDAEKKWWHILVVGQDGTGDGAKYTKKDASFKLR